MRRNLKGYWDELVEPPETIAPDAPLRNVIERLLENEETRTLLVVDGERYVGLISMANLLRYAEVLSGGTSPRVRELVRFSAARTARDVMFNPVSVPPSAKLSEVLAAMDEQRLPEIPVVQGDKVLGRVNSTRLLKVYLGEMG